MNGRPLDASTHRRRRRDMPPLALFVIDDIERPTWRCTTQLALDTTNDDKYML